MEGSSDTHIALRWQPDHATVARKRVRDIGRWHQERARLIRMAANMASVIAVIDYGMGNLRSVTNALRALGSKPLITTDPEDLKSADAIILPGVGAFGDGMRNLRDGGWVEPLEGQVLSGGKPFLGICLGMELLATQSLEHGLHRGLNWIEGLVDRIPAGEPPVRVPHIGWNDVSFLSSDGLYDGLGTMQTFYFVHGYVLTPADMTIATGMCRYGADFVASVERENIMATQFHPEKSHRAGMRVLRNFLVRSGAREFSRSA